MGWRPTKGRLVGPLLLVLAIPVVGLVSALLESPQATTDAPPSAVVGGSLELRPTPDVRGSHSLSTAPPAEPSPRSSGIVATRISIVRLGIDLPIVEGDGIDAPLDKAAHYPATGWPGGGSNIYIYGHAQEGMFLALWKAKIGDEVRLDLVDGSTRLYAVTEVNERVPWNAMEYIDPTPEERLTLQTSTSYFATSPRFIVIATPMG